jgi:transcription elongation factor Elf1
MLTNNCEDYFHNRIKPNNSLNKLFTYLKCNKQNIKFCFGTLKIKSGKNSH